MNNPGTLAILGTHDTGRREKQNTTRCCMLRRAKNTPTRSFCKSHSKQETRYKSPHQSHISNIKSFLPVEAEIPVKKCERMDGRTR